MESVVKGSRRTDEGEWWRHVSVLAFQVNGYGYVFGHTYKRRQVYRIKSGLGIGSRMRRQNVAPPPKPFAPPLLPMRQHYRNTCSSLERHTSRSTLIYPGPNPCIVQNIDQSTVEVWSSRFYLIKPSLTRRIDAPRRGRVVSSWRKKAWEDRRRSSGLCTSPSLYSTFFQIERERKPPSRIPTTEIGWERGREAFFLRCITWASTFTCLGIDPCLPLSISSLLPCLRFAFVCYGI